jgi:NitT/TauT family transport system ATP-binding protein
MSEAVFRIGFLPLVDAALPIVAREMGLAEAAGIRIEMVKDMSWATVRDRLLYGQTDAAHLLAPLAIATTLGLGRPAVPLLVPFNLGLNGNAITLRSEIAAEIEADPRDPAGAGRALAAHIAARKAKGLARLRMAVVHRFSSHDYILRYWLAGSGIDPEQDIEIVVVPPPFTVDAIQAGEIDGACVGEPWNSAAVDAGIATIVAATSVIWRRGVEKVLALRCKVAEERAEDLAALLRALHSAGKLLIDLDRREQIIAILARPEYLDAPPERIGRALAGRLLLAAGGETVTVPDFLLMHREAANFPWQSQALWLYSQMVRWGHAPYGAEAEAVVRRVFRPDIYRRALGGTGAALPGASAKLEGAIRSPSGVGTTQGRLIMGPDTFFDRRSFDPDDLRNYLEMLQGNEKN